MVMNSDPGTGVLAQHGQPKTATTLPTLQPKEKLNLETQNPGYQTAFTNLAFTPTALGAFGANLALQSGIARAKRTGERLGKNPEGDLLPPLTDVDKAFVDSYSSQAQATLGLQVNDMLNKAQEQMSEPYKLSPSAIKDFQSQMAAGTEDILANAPSTVRSKMENQYAEQIQSSAHSLTMKMIDEQKELTRSTQSAFNKDQMEAVHNAILDRDYEGADALYERQKMTVQSNLESGMYTPLEAQTQNDSNKQTYYAAKEIRNLLDARKKHELEPYLNGMALNKPEDLAWDEWEHVQSQAFSYINEIDSMAQREQSLLNTQLKSEAALGQLTADKVLYYKSSMQPVPFNNAMIGVISSNKSGNAQQRKVDGLTEALTTDNSVQAWALASSDVKNATFLALVDGQIEDAKQKGIELTNQQAKAMVAKTLPGTVPEYAEEVNMQAQSNNPLLLENASFAIGTIGNKNSIRLKNVSPQSFAMVEAYENYKKQGYDPVMSGEMAKETVINKSKEQIDLNDHIVAEWEKKHAYTESQKASFAKEFINSGSAYVPNQAALNNQIVSTYKDYLRYFNGDQNMAKSMLQKGMKRAYGLTNINGRPEYVYAPLEKITEIPEGGQPLFQQDIYNNIEKQLKPANDAFKNGTSTYFYRLKERTQLPEYLAAKDKMAEMKTIAGFAKRYFGLPSADKEFYKVKKTIEDFEKGSPVTIEQVFRDKHTEEFEVSIQPSPYLSISSSPDGTVGGYDMLMRGKDGLPQSIMGPFYGTLNPPVYRPDRKFIESNYFAVNDITPDTRSIAERAKEIVDRHASYVQGMAKIL